MQNCDLTISEVLEAGDCDIMFIPNEQRHHHGIDGLHMTRTACARKLPFHLAYNETCSNLYPTFARPMLLSLLGPVSTVVYLAGCRPAPIDGL